MVLLARHAATYGRMTVEGTTWWEWDSFRQSPAPKAFRPVGPSNGEEIWEQINQKQVIAVARKFSDESGRNARAGLQSR